MISDSQKKIYYKIKSAIEFNENYENNKVRYECDMQAENKIVFIFVGCRYACKIFPNGTIVYPMIEYPDLIKIIDHIQNEI